MKAESDKKGIVITTELGKQFIIREKDNKLVISKKYIKEQEAESLTITPSSKTEIFIE